MIPAYEGEMSSRWHRDDSLMTGAVTESAGLSCHLLVISSR